jgi:hypothetical protein
MKHRLTVIRPSVLRNAWAVVLVAGLPGLALAGDVLDVHEVASLLRIDAAEVVKLTESGELPGRRTPSGMRYSRPAVMHWVAGGEPLAHVTPLAATESGSLRARGSAPSESSTSDPASKSVSTVGSGVDSASASELFLRDNNVLLKPRQWSVSLNLSALTAEREQLIPDLGAMQNVYQSQFSAGLGLRYGVSEDFQLGLDIPLSKQSNVTALGNQVTATGGGFRVGTGSLSASYALLREESGRPGVTINAVAAPFGASKSVGAGVALTKSYDPVVLYGSAAYSKPVGSSDAKDLNFATTTLSGGFVFAVNQQFSLSAGLSAVIGKGQVEPSNLTWTRPSLQLGVGTMIAPGFYVEPRLSMALNGTRTVSFGVDIVYQ